MLLDSSGDSCTNYFVTPKAAWREISLSINSWDSGQIPYLGHLFLSGKEPSLVMTSAFGQPRGQGISGLKTQYPACKLSQNP